MVTSYKIIVQYHSQDTDMDTVKMQNISISLKSHMLPFYSNTYFPPPPAPPQPLATTNKFTISIILSFQECYINGII